jgi:hypothetical protein
MHLFRSTKFLTAGLIGALASTSTDAGPNATHLSPDAEATANCVLVGLTLEGYYIALLNGKDGEVEAKLARNRTLTTELAREATAVLKNELRDAKPTTMHDVKTMAANKFAACLDRKGVGSVDKRSYCYTYADLIRIAYKRRGDGAEMAAKTLPPAMREQLLATAARASVTKDEPLDFEVRELLLCLGSKAPLHGPPK